jgi:Metallo-peptidase family M12B Reprolysin-like
VAQCIGVGGDISMLHDFFGLRSVPVAKELSLLEQIGRLKNSHFHFNVILVGTDAFSSGELDDVNRAVFDTRAIYAKAGIGVGRVRWFAIPVGMADGHDDIGSDDEAVELTNSWTVHNNGLDVFLIRDGWTEDESQRAGLSDQYASCDKDADKAMSGSVVAVGGFMTGLAMAHEMGHDLGLHHNVDLDLDELDEATDAQIKNLMFPFAISTAAQLTPSQVVLILQHCLIQPGC